MTEISAKVPQWSAVEEQIGVRRVWCPAVKDPKREMCATALTCKEPIRRPAWPRDTPLTTVRMYLGEEPEPVFPVYQ